MLPFVPQNGPSLLNSTTSNASSCREPSGLAAPELQNLTPHDIEIIDAVIERAGPSATTFFTVFKAYSEVLKGHGLDPQEVVYYGKLLKLGTLRGKNWGEKWALVRSQMGQRPTSPTDGTSQTESEFVPLPQTRRDQLSNLRPVARQQKNMSSGGHKHIFDTKQRRASHSLVRSEKTGDLLQKAEIFHSKEDFLSSTVVHKGKIKLPLPKTTSEDGEISPVPPSYQSTMVGPILPAVPLRTNRGKAAPQADCLFSGKKIFSVPKERPKPAIDLDEAWKNIKMEQDEKYADEFRDNMLLTRCWDIWRQGYLWIITTHQQIQEARDKLLLRLFLQRWRDRLIARRVAEDQRVAQFSSRLLTNIFGVWKAKFKQKTKAAWREDMRQKMKLVKRKSELRIKRIAWTKWQRVLLLQRTQKHYEIGLLYRCFGKWQEKVVRLESVEQRADLFLKEAYFKLLDRLWHQWKFNTALRFKYLIMARRVESRIVADALYKWKTRMSQDHLADIFRDEQILKRTVNRWKVAKVLKANLEDRGDRYIARKDALFLQSVLRIWRARMRGRKLQRFMEITTLQDAWHKWIYRLSKEGAQKDVANNFLNRTNTRLLATTFQRWQQVLTTHQNASAYAIKYDEAHFQSKILLTWRMKLHGHLQMAKVARWANRYFVTRNAWRVWIGGLEERRRERKLRDFEVAKLRKFFGAWKCRTNQAQYLGQCEAILREHIGKKVLRGALTRWTNRVIDLKSRELDVAQQADAALLRAAFTKWKSCRRRHVEEVSLLENYLLVKREDILRRAFYRWLTAKRATEHRRLTHQRKEAQLRHVLITSAWDRWRERFKEERLRPLEYQLILDHQRHILQAAFKFWVDQTDSLPAVRFHSRNLKAKFFRIWKNALPNALKVKKGRETDRHNTLARYFQKWTRAYKTKTTLKAVERAKYLLLPSSSSRPPPDISRSRPFYAAASVFPRRRSISSEVEDTQAEENAVVVPTRRRSFNRLPLTQQARSEKSVSRSEYAPSVGRQPSPVRSIVSLPDRRSRSPGKLASVTATVVASDPLWDTIRKIGLGRRQRRL